MTVTITKGQPAKGQDQRPRSEIKFPGRSLADSVAVIDAVAKKGGGRATPDQLASYLGYRSTANGAYLSRIGAARTFGLMEKSGEFFVVTPLGQRIISPTYPQQSRQALVEAFLNVELFKRVFEEFKGKELPPEFGLKNALRNLFKVVPSRVEVAHRVLMDSAEEAGFFLTRGSRTHLILPPLQAPPAAQTAIDQSADEPAHGGGSGSGGDDGGDSNNGSRRSSGNMAAMKARYVETLLKLFEAKAEKGELDEALMGKIEKLLES